MNEPEKYIKEKGDKVELKGSESRDKGGTMEEETGNPAPVEERSRLDQDAYLKIVDTYHGRSVLLPHSRIWKEFSPLQNAMYKEEL